MDHDATLGKLLARDKRATTRFVRANTGWMLALARRYLKDDARAQDVVQNAFAGIFKNLNSFRGEASLRAWMHRIVINEALMALRKTKRLREQPIDGLGPEFHDNGCRIEDRWPDIETPEQLLERAQTRALVFELIESLPEPYRVVLLLRDIEELDTQETADMLAISQANVKVRLHRARAALKKRLEPVLKGQSP